MFNTNIVIKMNIIKNAIEKGWTVEKTNDNTFILKKSIHKLNNDEKSTDILIDTLLDIRKFNNFDPMINKKYIL
jgi:hypothetical protein